MSKFVNYIVKKFVIYFLKDFIGKYCSNFDENALNIGLSGKFELVGLKIRSDALHDIHQGIDIIDGFIGKVGINVNSSKIQSEPIYITLEDITIVCSLKDLSNSPEAIKKKLIDYNLSKYKALEKAEQKKAEQYANSLINNEKKGNESKEAQQLYQRLLTKLIINSQICIKNIHIRYEDNTNKKHPVVIGVFLASLNAHSTDSNFTPAVNTQGNIAYKIVELNNFSAYYSSSSLAQFTQSDKESEKECQIVRNKENQKTKAHLLMIELISQQIDGNSENIMYNQKEKNKEIKEKFPALQVKSGNNEEQGDNNFAHQKVEEK
ncbi:MAG: putative Vacuolar protein sorting-associated protein 13A N-terminal domain [Streblomastix strix]|uniref:Putative Vacuolar protein sorting-associated protein 13A N-terminal domain n=1 Tax=Streblomastix strix TaxID=222440 RepID=A0A5J4VS84_9EUKA|nr:MAG: putative Vacuolar protein sorting-associated protein 13A N-terminal domain [Streblomastix strix]